MSGLANFLRFAAFFLLVAAVVGFALFVREARGHGPAQGAQADAVVVLTGGPGRVATAVALLEDRRGARLLISGVNPGSPVADIAAAAGASDALFECCVDVGAEAADTVGNAAETARWAAARGYDSLIVVTNTYHMPRALLELQAAMPDTRLVAASFDCVASNSLLHHLPEPDILWRAVRELAAPGARVQVMDLDRPTSMAHCEALLERHAAGEPEVLREDFRNSLIAAWGAGEVRDQLVRAGLALDCQRVSDRHWLVAGVL